MVPDSPISADPESRAGGAAIKFSEESFRPQAQDRLLSDCRQRYGLSADPFGDDQEFPLFTGAQRRELLDQLLHLCQFGNSALVVLGGRGVGKTRIANALLDSLAETDEACLIDAQPQQTAGELLAQIAGYFDLRRDAQNRDAEGRGSQESTGQLLAALRSYSQPVMGSRDIALIVIDNAHHLDNQTLAALLSLLQGREGDACRLHLAFFADPSLIGRLDQLDMEDVLINDFYLEPFTLAETVDYLNFRMEMADYLGPEIFSESLVEPWWIDAQGQLPVVHDYASACLLQSVLPPLSATKKPFPVLHIFAAAVLGAVFLMVFFYGSGEDEEVEASVVSQSIPINPLPVSSSESVQSSAPVSSDSPSSVALSIPTMPADVMDVTAASSASASQSVDSIIEPVTEPVVESIASPAVSEPSPPVASVASSTPAPVEAKAQSSVAVKSTSSAAASPVKQTAALTEDEQVLMSWRTSEFTLQLLGVSSEKAARDFIAGQENREDLLMFKSLRQGKDWFVVVTGRYSNASTARAAIAGLPAPQQKAGPWPREMKIIQKEIGYSN